jgi:hypothetical protein
MTQQWWQQPWVSIVVGAAIFAALEALKRWRWAQEHILAGPWSDLCAVALLAVASALPRLLAGEPLDAVAQAAGTSMAAALGTWALQAGAARARLARRAGVDLGGAP